MNAESLKNLLHEKTGLEVYAITVDENRIGLNAESPYDPGNMDIGPSIELEPATEEYIRYAFRLIGFAVSDFTETPRNEEPIEGDVDNMTPEEWEAWMADPNHPMPVYFTITPLAPEVPQEPNPNDQSLRGQYNEYGADMVRSGNKAMDYTDWLESKIADMNRQIRNLHAALDKYENGESK